MPRSFLATIVLAAILGNAATTASAIQISIVGPWRIMSGQSPTGPFCTMQLGQLNKVFSLQVRTDGSAFATVSDPDWTLTPQKRLPIKIGIDGTPKMAGEAVAVSPNTVVLPVNGKDDPANAIVAGKSLVATVDDKPLAFDLTGAPAAHRVLETCLGAQKTP